MAGGAVVDSGRSFPTRPTNYCATEGSERRLGGVLKVRRDAAGSVGLA